MASNADTPEWYERVFGTHLIRCTHNYIDDNHQPIDAIVDTCDVVGVYCVAETSGNLKRLMLLYESVNDKADGNGVVGRRKRLELIQVGDANTTQDCPWFALDGVERKERLLRRYGIQEPTHEWLLLLDAFSGDVITSSGLERLIGDPAGSRFPWSPRSVAVVLHEAVLVNAVGTQVPVEQLAGKVKGFYFSANWCPPCRAFTPQLIETYACVNAKDHRLEVIMVSSDRSQESFDAYLCSMPWLAISYEQEDLRRELASLFGVGGIPTLVLVDQHDRVITAEGRAEVNEDPSALNFPWKPKLVNILTERFAARLSEAPAVIIFIDGDEEEMEFATSALQPVAESQSTSGDDANKLMFLVGCDSDASDRLHEFFSLDDAVPLATLVDLPGNRVATLLDEVTSRSVDAMVRSFRDGTLEMRPIIADTFTS